MKIWVGLFTFFFYFSIWANCHSELFRQSSNDTLARSYPHGAEAMRTQYNEVSPTIHQSFEGVFSEVHRMVQRAQKHIYLQTWRFAPNSHPAIYFADALKRLANQREQNNVSEPLHVWMLLNILPTASLSHKKQQMEAYIQQHNLNRAGIQVHVGFFHTTFLGALHSKSLSIDNKEALITGANFSTSYGQQASYFDLGFVVRGDVVKNIDYDFIQTWISYVQGGPQPNSWGENLSRQTGQCTPILFARNVAYSGDGNAPGHSGNDSWTPRIPRDASINDTFMNLAHLAQSKIQILTPNLNVDDYMNKLIEAMLRGVQVQIVLSKHYLSGLENVPSRGGDNRVAIEKIFDALLQVLTRDEICQRMDIRWYSVNGQQAVSGSHPPASHAKMTITDGTVTYFGSANMDVQSWNNSKEIGLFVDDRNLSRRWSENLFNPIFNRAIKIHECGGPI